MSGHYDPVLVALSFVIAVLASWVALDLAARVHGQHGHRGRQLVWLLAGSLSMGSGIWAMHFVGMQAYRMAMPVLYDWPTVLVSVVAAVLASGVAFFAITWARLTWKSTVLSGTVMGGGIASMHYLGMAAMRMPATISYSLPLVALSVLVAVAIAMTALRLTFGLRDLRPGLSWRKAGCALLMGAAIPTMHYLGMAAARWQGDLEGFAPARLTHAVALSQVSFSLVVGLTLALLGLMLVLAGADRHATRFETALHGSRRSFAQLQDHHERLQRAFRASGVGTWECDPTTELVYVDPGMRELYHLPQGDEPIPRDMWRARVHPEDGAEMNARWRGSIATGDTLTNEYRIVRPDGQVRRVRTVASLLRSDDGVLRRILGMTWDVTAERRREQEIAEQAESFRTTLESIGDAVISTDERQRIVFLNRAACELTRWSLEEACGRALVDVVDLRNDADEVLWADPAAACLARGGTLPVEGGVLASRNGPRHHVHGHIALIGASGAVVVTLQDVTASRRMERDLHDAATFDGLTGLLNRGAFERQLHAAWESTRSSDRMHCLCMVDLDRFKIVNDTAGHLAGDALLRAVARVMQAALQPGDVAARMGGDHFLLLLLDCAREEGEARTNALLENVSDLQFPWGNRVYDVTARSGLVILDRFSQSPQVLLSQADVAAFSAKRNGRNQVSVYTGNGGGAADDHQEMEVVAGLRRSLEQNRFELYAQPIVPVAHPKLEQHYELLIRMRNESGELLSPALFVPAAERYGLMGMVDRWVIRAALDMYSSRFLADPKISFSINLSAESLNDASLWEFVAERFAATGVPPDRITFEVTETGLIGNFDHARGFVDRARQAGCRIALDDFGTGLSSLSYLKQFALDSIKIDGGFIRTLRDNPLDQAIIRSIAEIARSMEASTVAECVEEADTLEMLMGLGVDYAQGWATGRPRPLTDVAGIPAVMEAVPLLSPQKAVPPAWAAGHS